MTQPKTWWGSTYEKNANYVVILGASIENGDASDFKYYAVQNGKVLSIGEVNLIIYKLFGFKVKDMGDVTFRATYKDIPELTQTITLHTNP